MRLLVLCVLMLSACVAAPPDLPPDEDDLTGELREPWRSADVGMPVLSGSASYEDGRFLVEAAGRDIWSAPDEFHYVYQERSGDFEMIARVDSFVDTGRSAKAGLMIRESLDASARYAFMRLNPEARSRGMFQYRVSEGVSTEGAGAVDAGIPWWLRIVRSGNTIIGYHSSDGSSLTEAGRVSIDIGGEVLVGLAATSHNQDERTSVVFSSVDIRVPEEPSQDADVTGVLWADVLEWDVENPSYTGNPFDIIADVVFSHTSSDAEHRTQMFYAGDDVWKFRFTGTRTGLWTYASSSDDPDLDGLSGTVYIEQNPDPNAHGFLTTAGNRFAVPINEDGTLKARHYNVYYNHADNWQNFDWDPVFSLDPEIARGQIDRVVDEAIEHGADAIFLTPKMSWLRFGAASHSELSDEENPDLTTFDLLDTIIARVHERGLSVHIWKWGDEQRRQTPLGLGGINGEIDRRLQRYIAARLGPMPGWTLAYGFDMQEWVEPSEVREWHRYMHEHLGWPRLLMAREEIGSPPKDFYTPDEMDVFSNDERFIRDQNYYDQAVDDLNQRPRRPVLYERRFLYTRDNVWTMDNTRRAWWQFTLAGGASGIWGVLWASPEDAKPYPNPEQFQTHARFWEDRFLLDLERAPGISDGYAMRDSNRDHYVIYEEDTASVRMDLSNIKGVQPAVAVDTKSSYEEISLGMLDAQEHVWDAPYASDWVIAVGAFE